MNGTINVALTNLGQYNEGILNFVWLELPATDEEIARAYDAIQVSHDDIHYYSDGLGHASTDASRDYYGEYEEAFITDYECDFMDIHEYANLEELNEIAEQMEGLQEYERTILQARMDNGEDFEYALDHIGDAYYMEGVKNSYDLGEYCAEEYGALDRVPDDLRDFFDFEAYGEYLENGGTFIYTDNGCVEIF